MNSLKFVLATGNEGLHSFLENTFKNDDFTIAKKKSEIVDICLKKEADCLLVYEGLGDKENIYQLLTDLSKKMPNLRIIFISKEIKENDEVKIHNLRSLVSSGIYDIIYKQPLVAQDVIYIIRNKQTLKDVQFIVDKSQELLSNIPKDDDSFDFIIENEEELTESVVEDTNNIYVVSSIKPGTGKSFVSTNVATAIAKFGIKKADGTLPRVALVEADLQNLSLGTLLNIEDDNYNLISAIKEISTMCDNDKLRNNLMPEEIEEVKKFVLKCFKPYEHGNLKNLCALVGSQHYYEEVSQFVQPIHYAILLKLIASEFDVIIVDSNSSLSHITTQAIATAAKRCYYVLNLDFNNVRNNIRYQNTLKEYNILDKTRYILNEDIPVDHEDYNLLDYNAEKVEEHLNLVAKIPMIKKTIFLNCTFDAKPIVTTEFDETIKARYELFKVANQIYLLENFKQIENKVLEMEQLNSKRKKGFFAKK